MDTHTDVYLFTNPLANLNPSAHMDTHSYIYLFTNPFEYTVPIRYGYSCSNILS
jgi:hypothetical protein